MCHHEIMRFVAQGRPPIRLPQVTRRTATGGAIGLGAAAALWTHAGRPARQESGRRVVELTHPLSAAFPVYPG